MDWQAKLYAWTQSARLRQWVEEIITLCTPSEVELIEGTKAEFDRLASHLVESKVFIRLNEELRPNSFLARSDPADVARLEKRTFICSEKKEDAGPTNQWKAPHEMHAILKKLYQGCMQGRTMYVIPYCMGPLNSKLSYIGIEITDSPYVVCNMMIMARVGRKVLEMLKDSDVFIPGVHSVGCPLKEGDKDVPWPCNPKQCYVVHFPEEKSIWSFGSGYGGNALLGKKCFALRIASVLAKEEGWLAEHMLIVGITNPKGKKKYFAAAFPSACGKTNLAMLTSTLPGWKVECVGDDIAWMRFKEDGRLYAINPESGFFGVAPGTSFKSNPNAMYSMAKNTIFTNVALTANGDVWWEGMNQEPHYPVRDWHDQDWNTKSESLAAHANARFTAPAKQCPIIDPNWESPQGVPIDGIIFGGRRSTTLPLVYQSFNWQHGTFLGTSVSSEGTAASEASLGSLRHDPFAMLPFCGYHMGDYFAHWLSIGKKSSEDKLPKIFHVNWFKKDQNNQFIWPGFGENIRVMKWIFESIDKEASTQKSPIGYIPAPNALDIKGLNLTESKIKQLFEIDKKEWQKEVKELKKFYTLFENKLPKEISEELEALETRIQEL